MRIRVPSADLELIDRARAPSGTARSAFMVAAAIARAETILIEQAHRRTAEIFPFKREPRDTDPH